MKTLTLTQPWATLVAIGAKQIETRSWGTNYRGPLAIHAAKGWKREDRDLCWEGPFEDALLNGLTSPGTRYDASIDTRLPRGAVIATCTLRACFRFTESTSYRGPGGVDTWYAFLREPELSFGNFAPGRFGWLLDDVVMLPEPVPAKGALGLWEWNPDA